MWALPIYTRRSTISIHALLAESDAFRSPRIALMVGFLSTLSLRRATQCRAARLAAHSYFYPRSPCGERQQMPNPLYNRLNDFYPRSPCGERRAGLSSCFGRIIFLSTLSLRRATALACLAGFAFLFLSTLSLRRATAKVHKTVGHFCAYETNFMGIASSC